MDDLTVQRARLEEVQPLAAEFRRDAARSGASIDTPLPTGALFWRATLIEGSALRASPVKPSAAEPPVASSRDGQPVGYAAGTLRPEGLVLGPVYVRPAARRRGIGLALLHGIEDWADSAGIPVVEVSVATDNVAGRGFLEAAGYRARRVLMARDPVTDPDDGPLAQVTALPTRSR